MTNPTDPNALTNPVNATTSAVTASDDAITKYNDSLKRISQEGITNVITSLLSLNEKSKDLLAATNSNIDAIDLITTEVLGATKAFDGFTDNIAAVNLFTTQITDLGDATAFTTNIMAKFAGSLGMSDAFSKSGGAIKDFIGKIAASADGAVKLQQEYIGMMGATGGLSQVFTDAGDNLGNLNDMMQVQRTLIDDIADSTATSATKVSSFYAALGKAIPQSTDLQVNAGNEAGLTMNNLEAAMKLATGTGRTQGEMVKDLSTAWETYGLEGDKALEFTQRMSDLSSKFNINLDYTRGFLTENANAFKMLTNNGTDAADTFNRLFPALRETGLSAKEASGLIGDVTTSVSKLTMAQKIHLSQQMGGPGGLRGGFQVEQMIRKGDIDKLLQTEINDVIKRNGGRIFTQEEAANDVTGFSAQGLQRQNAMLQSGAFGGMVKDSGTAERLFEAVKKGTSVKEALEPVANTVAKSVDRGAQIQQATNTILSQQLRNLERLRGVESIKDLKLLQNTVGTGTATTAISAESLRNATAQATIKANQVSSISNQHMGGTASVIDTSKEREQVVVAAIDQMEELVPNILKPALESLKQAITSSKAEDQSKGAQDYQKVVDGLTQQQNTITKSMAEHGGKISPEDQEKLKAISNERAQLASLSNMYTEYTGRSLGVAQAAQTVTANPPNAQTSRGRAGDAPVPMPPQKVIIETTGISCVHCHTPIAVNQHTNIITGGASTLR